MDHVGDYLGVTPPLSLQEPTEAEKEASQNLRLALDGFGVFEVPEGHKHRKDVIEFLNGLVDQWVIKSTTSKAKPWTQDTREQEQRDTVMDSMGARLLPSGGQQLGVVTKSSDIDLVCVVPWDITRNDFFTSFFTILKSQDNICELRAIEAARVPIIHLKCMGIEVDICLARLPVCKIHDHLDLTDNDLLKKMDPLCIRSFNGVRDTLVIQELVPSMEGLQQVVYAVKVWAKAKGLNGTGYGYPSGIAWTIMAARVCQLYPTATSSTLLHKFFAIFSKWLWPQPVLLKVPHMDTLNLHPWNPKVNAADGYQVMPVITPAYPEHNATFVVTQSTLKVFKQQITADADLTACILNGKGCWQDLFQPLNFFRMYKHFLMVSANAVNEDGLLDWYGLIKSRLRHLVASIESESAVQLVHPWPCHFIDNHAVSCRWFLGLQFEKADSLHLNLAPNIKTFIESIHDLAQSKMIFKTGMKLDIKHIRRKELREVLSEDNLTPHPVGT